MNTFLPKDYKEPPVIKNYMKFRDEENRFRILSAAITGFEYFNTSNKPVRSREPFATHPKDIKDGGTIKHFWAFVVYNHNDAQIAEEAGLPTDSAVQILEVTQKTIQSAILSYVHNKKWGDFHSYDFVVKKEGEGIETEYNVIAEPHSELKLDKTQTDRAESINLEALYTGEDPFGGDKPTHKETAAKPAPEVEEDINPEDIPF